MRGFDEKTAKKILGKMNYDAPSYESILDEAEKKGEPVVVVAMRLRDIEHYTDEQQQARCGQCGEIVIHRSGIPADRLSFICNVCFANKVQAGELNDAEFHTTQADLKLAVDTLREQAKLATEPLKKN